MNKAQEELLVLQESQGLKDLQVGNKNQLCLDVRQCHFHAECVFMSTDKETTWEWNHTSSDPRSFL